MIFKNKISYFIGEYRFLSNFYPAEVLLGSMVFRTVEHAWQAAKTDDIATRREIQKLYTPNKAKGYGRQIVLKEGWDKVKLLVMRDLLNQKFKENEYFRSLLKNTGQVQLIEGNGWHDNYWGKCNCQTCRRNGAVGQNHLGRILMQIRSEIREVSPFDIPDDLFTI